MRFNHQDTEGLRWIGVFAGQGRAEFLRITFLTEDTEDTEKEVRGEVGLGVAPWREPGVILLTDKWRMHKPRTSAGATLVFADCSGLCLD